MINKETHCCDRAKPGCTDTRTHLPCGCSRTLLFLFFFIIIMIIMIILCWTCWWMMIGATGCDSPVSGSSRQRPRRVGGVVDVRRIGKTLSHWWMERSSPPHRWPCSTAMADDKLHTCLSLFNEHQVPSVCELWVCVRCQDQERLGKALCFNLSSVLHGIHPRQHRHT